MTMKKKISWLLPLSFILSACPYESTVPLVARPTELVDTTLIGYWYGIISDGSDYFGIEALEVTKKSDSLYSITRYGKGIKGDIVLPDTAYYTGFISYIGDVRFMNVEGSVIIVTPPTKKQPELRKEKKFYYLSSIEQRKDTLSVKTIVEDFTISRRALNTPEVLNSLVTDLLGQKKSIYDEVYSLSYRKIPKPKPIKPL